MRGLLLGVLLIGVPACAAPHGLSAQGTTLPPPRSAAETKARLHFLEERLAANRHHAQLWQWGWTGVDGGGLVASAVGAARTGGDGERAENVVEAVQAAIGLAELWVLRPMPGRSAPAHEGGAAQRLAAAERQMVEVAQRGRERFDWRPHAGNLALQLASAGVLLGLGEPGRAGFVFATGVLSGELYVWSEPWGGERNLADYRALVAGAGLPREPEARFEAVPTPFGVALRVTW